MTILTRFLAVSCFCLGFCGFSAFGQSVAVTDADVVWEKPEPTAPEPIALKRQIADKRADVRLEPAFLQLRAPLIDFGTRHVRASLLKLASDKQDKILVLREAVFRESQRYGIDPDLVFSVIWEESRARFNAVSPKGARGPMQMLPETAARFGARNAHDPEQAVRAGVGYLVWLLDRYRGNVSLALGAYNSGEGATDAFSTGRTIVLRSGKVINRRGAKTGIPPYTETQEYVRRIANRYRALKSLPR